MPTSPPDLESSQYNLRSISRSADLVMFLAAIGSTCAAVSIGAWYGNTGFALAAGALVLSIGATLFAFARGTALSRAGLTTCNVALVALHIQLGRGTIEFHFGVFVLLGVLLVYRDWRPLLLAAGLFAAHHVLFDRLQALDLGVYCTPEANFLKTAMHAVYVVVQTGIEIHLPLILHKAAREATELTAIMRVVDADGAVCLDLSGVAVTAPTAVLMKAMLARVSGAVSEVSGAAQSVERAASEIASGSMELSRRTEHQASSLQQTAASMAEITGSVRNTADTAGRALRLSTAASSAAVDGGRVVDGIIVTMEGIAQSSRKMSEIIGVIDGIAFQTNILALNAAVEAARAGEQGKGFAVVASEVRSLSKRSTSAAREIRTLICASTERVDSGTRLVGQAGTGMRDVVDQAGEVGRLIGDISAAASRQTEGIGQVGDAVAHLDTVTQQNVALVEESAAASESLRHQAARLNDIVRQFVLAPA